MYNRVLVPLVILLTDYVNSFGPRCIISSQTLGGLRSALPDDKGFLVGCSRHHQETLVRRNSKQTDISSEEDGNEQGNDDIPLGPSADVAASSDDGATEDDDDDDDDAEEDYLPIATKIPTEDSPRWELGNDFEHFLNQCTIQSFLYLLKTCRDPQTVLWVERFAKPAISARLKPVNASQALPSGGSGDSKLLSYHGLAAMNTTEFPTWDTFFAKLLQQPHEAYLIESHQAHIPSYEMEINPPSLCARMISVREQIAREFAKDLTVLADMGEQILRSYWQKISPAASSGDDPLRSGSTVSLLFLEFDPDEESDYAPSPLRKGNFDLLMLLATQHSIHRVLNGRNSKDDEPLSQRNLSFLSNFYLNRLVSHFTGRQRYGRADEFLQELLSSSPSIMSPDDDKNDDDDASRRLVDPMRIAERILTERQKVATEWAAIAASVPDAHMEIKRLQLDLLMKSYEKEEDAFQ